MSHVDDVGKKAADGVDALDDLANAGRKKPLGETSSATKGYSNFADGMSPEDAARYISNNEKAFLMNFLKEQERQD